MESQGPGSNMSLDDIRMSSTDLLDKREIDCGGFGKVFLCCHRTHGLVALKTVFTGNKTVSYNNNLYEEGKKMYKLNHERIVKLIGIILEDCNYALVMEYMTKGNLLHVLKQIADLGVAAFQTWSTLTKEETFRQGNKSNSTTKNAGTLSYMAPEHLENLNKKATRKSDIYSFAIVIWVILANKEPYENAINSAQLSLRVTCGDRPDVEESKQSGLEEVTDLMQECWREKPEDRPSFEDCEQIFRPIYFEKYEKDVAKDVAAVQESYPKPDAFIQRMASLQLDCDAEPPSIPRDEPLSLHSSLGMAHGQVNETYFTARNNEPVECEEEKCDNLLERKLEEEMNYHRTGSRIDNMTNLSNPPPVSDLRSRKVFSEPQERNSTPAASYPASLPFGCNNEPSAHVAPPYAYNVMQNPNTLHTASRPVDFHQPNEPQSRYYQMPQTWNPNTPPHTFQDLYGADIPFPLDASNQPVIESGRPSVYSQPQSHSHNAALSHPVGLDGIMFPKGNFAYAQPYHPEKSVNLTISNSTAFQIGSNNYLNVTGESDTKNKPIAQGSNYPPHPYAEILVSNSLLNENQMQLLRDNLSRKWKGFARIVGFRQPEIDEIDHDCERDGLKEKVYQMLHKWQMKEGSKSVTVGKVASALFQLQDTDLLNQLIQYK
ncbi:receptor-interacting serine/threonine-protein kinase 1 isoform 2-T2 [Leptodactylus fuscus]|uniref:receptor-interacting serine/threonine-protein kinase 1 isoform X2 n=1 Tax=Leptodactylus fuscus TaxID=238119 RepID=UPI003F4E6721